MKEYTINYNGDFVKNFNNVICDKNIYANKYGGHMLGNVFCIKLKTYGFVLNPNPYILRGRLVNSNTIEYKYKRSIILSSLFMIISVFLIVTMYVFISKAYFSVDGLSQRNMIVGCLICVGMIIFMWVPQIICAKSEKKKLYECLKDLACAE